MKLQFQSITRQHALLLTSWRYAPPYDVYNRNDPPSDAEIAYWLDPAVACHAVMDASQNSDVDALVAFCTFGPDGQVGGGDYRRDALDIGMGVRPDLTGQGLGAHFAQAAIDFARQTYHPPALRVTIAAFNQRAIRVWEKLDFHEVQRFPSAHNGREFIVFLRQL
ncbi:MAG: GNAT family N-acetyltransferase [Caldilineaceae bacterium]